MIYPYLPKGRIYRYKEVNDIYMTFAKNIARYYSLDDQMPTGAAIVINGNVLASGANGSIYHKKYGCKRKALNMPTGEGYNLCEGCHPKNHAETKAIMDAISKSIDIHGADIYLWGHWWACKYCWQSMISIGIKDIFLLKDSNILFNKENPNNVIGHQFDNID